MADKKKCQNLTEDGIRIFPEADWTQARGHRSTLYPACTHQSEERLVLAHGLLRLREVSQVTIGFTPFLPSPACRWISSSTKRSLDRHLSCRGEELRWGNLSQSVIFFFFLSLKCDPCCTEKDTRGRDLAGGKWKVKVKSLSHVWPFATPCTIAYQVSPSMGFFQATVPEWVAISFSRESSVPRDRTRVSRTAGKSFTLWASRGGEG